MKYYIIAGEASGDLHGSNLIRALHREDPQAEVRCWGGDRMRQAGVRRLPIVDAERRLIGLVSLDDVLVAANGTCPTSSKTWHSAKRTLRPSHPTP